MKKFTHLLLLCVLMIVSAFTAKAQTAAVMQTSAAPDDNGFAADTHWYTMWLRGCYISVGNVDNDSYLKVSNSFDPFNDIDKALWCIVGDETKGYKLYNKSEGPTKVLAVKYIDSDGSAYTKMVDANTVDATEKGEGKWRVTFDFHKNTGSEVGGYTISAKGVTNYYLNKRDPYLACWFDAGALEEVGSSFYFYDAARYSSTINLQASAYYTGTNFGGIFQPTQEEYNNFQSQLEAHTSITTWDEIKNIHAQIESFQSTINNHKPELGKKYLIKNNYFAGQMIIPNVIPGGNLDKYTGDGNKVKSAVWIFEQGSTEGTYKLKNAYSGLYVNGTKVNETGSDLLVGPASTYNGTFAIGTSFSGNNSLHSNASNGYLILWEANAGASRWVAEAISDEDYQALRANVPQAVNNLIVNDVFESNPAAEKAALQAEPNYQNYMAYIQAVKKVTDNQYVRLQCAKGGNDRMLGVNDAYSATSAVASSTKNTAVSNIWKLVPSEDGYKLLNVNTNQYITNLPNAETDGSSTAQLTSEIGQGCKFTFTVNNATNKTWNVIDNVIDGNNKKLNAETNGRINYWKDNGNGGWKITKATDIEVALHALGDASYASVYLPFGVSAVEGAAAYVAESPAENNSLVVKTTADGGFGANTGVVLVSDTKAEKATLTIGDNNNASSMLTGSNTPVPLTDDTRSSFFVFGPKDGETSTVGFWTPASTITTIPANRAYYQNVNGQAVALVFDGCTTGIEGVTINGSNENVQAPIFDLAGRRVANVVKGGVYIQNGKKFIK
mgnify:CR=1 FL=1